MEEVYRAFRDVDQAPVPESLVSFLDSIDTLDWVQSYRQRMVDLHPPTEGCRILDVGCGIGHSAQRLAEWVGSRGSVVGIDKSEAFLREARRRAAARSLPIEYQVGDAGHLNFPAESFDLCRTERVLQYLEAPEQALDEMVRVLRPGGSLVLFEFDCEEWIADSPDRALTRRIASIVADSIPSPWIGRQAPRLLRERGLQGVSVIPYTVLLSYELYRRLVGGPLERAVEAGELPADEVAAWWHHLERLDDGGQFLGACVGFVVGGHKP